MLGRSRQGMMIGRRRIFSNSCTAQKKLSNHGEVLKEIVITHTFTTNHNEIQIRFENGLKFDAIRSPACEAGVI